MDRNNNGKPIVPGEDYNEQNEHQDEFKEERSVFFGNEPAMEPPKKENLFKRVLMRLKTGGLLVGGGTLLLVFSILNFVFNAVVILGLIWFAITLFSEGSIIWGLLVLLVGVPLAFMLVDWAFIFFLLLGILVGIIWGIANLFGFGVAYWSIWDVVWLAIKILILGFMAYVGFFGFIEATRERRVLEFFKEYWWGILIFCFLFWLFFL